MLKHLILDLDGTLFDSAPGIYSAFCDTCTSLFLPIPDQASFKELIGPPISVISAMLYPELAPTQLDEFTRLFRLRYDSSSYKLASPYPYVSETLGHLASELGLLLTIVTNKPTIPAAKLIKDASLQQHFERIIGIDYCKYKAQGDVFIDKRQAISYTLQTSPWQISSCAYLGDTFHDYLACNELNLTFIAALYGYYSWTSASMPALYIHNFKQISDLASRLC